MFKQMCFFKKREDMSLQEMMDYYENQHAKLSEKLGRSPSLPNAKRYVRRYITPEKNPITGEVHDCGFDCVMEIWWNSREDFENSQRIIASPDRIEATKTDEEQFLATHANPIVSIVEEFESPMGPNGEATHVDLRYED